MHEPAPSQRRPGDRPARLSGETTSRRFRPKPAAVAQARTFVREQLPDPGSEAAGKAVLMVSELVTNAIEHSTGDVDVSVVLEPEGGGLLVEVHDGGGGFPTPAWVADDAPHGRGLHIVRCLADDWGVEVRHGLPGKSVWFTT